MTSRSLPPPPLLWKGEGRVYKLTFLSYPLLIFQMDLWRCPSSSSSPPRDNWFFVETVYLCNAPPPTWTSRWSCGGVTTATSWPRRRTEASTWRKPCFTTAACLPGTRRGERRGRRGGREIKLWAESWLAVDWPVALTRTHTSKMKSTQAHNVKIHMQISCCINRLKHTQCRAHMFTHSPRRPSPHLSLTHRSCDLPFCYWHPW